MEESILQTIGLIPAAFTLTRTFPAEGLFGAGAFSLISITSLLLPQPCHLADTPHTQHTKEERARGRRFSRGLRASLRRGKKESSNLRSEIDQNR